MQNSYRQITQVYQSNSLFTMILKEANIENATQYTTPNIKDQLEPNKNIIVARFRVPQL